MCVCVCVFRRYIQTRAFLNMHVSIDRVLRDTYILSHSLIFPSSDPSYKTDTHVPADIVPLSVASDRLEMTIKVI